MSNIHHIKRSSTNIREIFTNIRKIRAKKILIHHLRSCPVAEITHKICSALAIKNIASAAVEEIEEIVSRSSTLLIGQSNISAEWFQGAYIAAQTAKKQKKTVIIDLEKTNFSEFRAEIYKQIVELNANIIKGNIEEINYLQTYIEGLENNKSAKRNFSDKSFSAAIHNAQKLSTKYKSVVIIEGSNYFITNGLEQANILNSSCFVADIPNFSNAITSMVAAFSVVNTNYLKASINAISLLMILAEILNEDENIGLGNFDNILSDKLAKVTPSMLSERLKVY